MSAAILGNEVGEVLIFEGDEVKGSSRHSAVGEVRQSVSFVVQPTDMAVPPHICSVKCGAYDWPAIPAFPKLCYASSSPTRLCQLFPNSVMPSVLTRYVIGCSGKSRCSHCRRLGLQRKSR